MRDIRNHALSGFLFLMTAWGGCSLDGHTGGISASLAAPTDDISASSPETSRKARLATPAFLTAGDYSVVDPFSLAVGDLNNDGAADLIAASSRRRSVAVLLGDGYGGFSVPMYFPVRSYPSSVVVADFNRDNKLDVAVSVRSTTVSLLLGDGRGGLGAATDFKVEDGNFSLAVGDFNLDDKLDLAVATQCGTVDVLLGDGGGSFAAFRSFSVPGSIYSDSSVAIADFNLDKKPDLAVSIGTGVSVLLGDGLGKFGTVADVGMLGSTFLFSADLNNDGQPDLITSDRSREVWVLSGNGRGSFSTAKFAATAGTGYGLAVGDFNDDKKQDIVVSSCWVDKGFNVLSGNGLGDFSASTHFQPGRLPRSVVVGDFNGDTRPDLAVADDLENKISILIGLGGVGVP